MKKLLIAPLVLIFSLFTPLVQAAPKADPENEAQFMTALLQLWGESVPYDYLLSNIDDPDIKKLLDVGYTVCNKLTELTSEEGVTAAEIIDAMEKDEDKETREYGAITKIAVINLCPELQ